MIRGLIIIGSCFIVSGALYISFLPAEVTEKVPVIPKWQPLQIDPVLMDEPKNKSYKSSFEFHPEEGNIRPLPRRPFPYQWAGYVRSGSLTLVVLKDVFQRKEWILSEGDTIPGSGGYQLEQINNRSILLISNKTEKQKTLLYGKEVLDDLYWQVQLSDGSCVEMQGGDIVEISGKKWKLIEQSTDPPEASIIPQNQFYVSDTAPDIPDTNSL